MYRDWEASNPQETEVRRMARKSLCVLRLLPVWLAVGCASGESFVSPDVDFSVLEKVAVVEVEGALRGENAENTIASFFEMQLQQRGYTVVERRQVEALLAEQDFQRSDLTSDEGVVAAGRILNLDAVVMVNVLRFDEEISLTAKMVRVEDAVLAWSGAGEGTTGRTLSTIAGGVLGAVTGGLLGGSRSGRIVGGVAGGVLGGVGGYALSPQQSKQARKIIRKLCRDMPAR